MMKKSWQVYIALATTVALLAGCGQSSPTTKANTTPANSVAVTQPTNTTTNTVATGSNNTATPTANSTMNTVGNNTSSPSSSNTTTKTSTSTSKSATPAPTTKSTTTTTPTKPAPAPAPTKPAPTPPPSSPWLQYDKATKTATLELVASYNGGNGGFNFDGYSLGEMTVTIPTGWTVNVTYKNAGSSTGHSATIVPYAQRSSASGFTSAFSGSSTPNPDVGIIAGSSQSMHFVASESGHYAIICGVSGHSDAGMWDTFNVSSTAYFPSVTIGPEVLS